MTDEQKEIEVGHKIADAVEKVLCRLNAESGASPASVVGGAMEAAIRLMRRDGMSDGAIAFYMLDLSDCFTKGHGDDIPAPSLPN
jgi:hypothetical protein